MAGQYQGRVGMVSGRYPFRGHRPQPAFKEHGLPPYSDRFAVGPIRRTRGASLLEQQCDGLTPQRLRHTRPAHNPGELVRRRLRGAAQREVPIKGRDEIILDGSIPVYWFFYW